MPLNTTFATVSKRGLQGSAFINVASPVVYYDISNSGSYPGSGTTVFDLSGNGYNAIISNLTYSNTAGANALGSFGFNGVDSQFTGPVINELQLLLDAPRTFQMWVRLNTLPASGMALFNKDGGLGGFKFWSFAIGDPSQNVGTYSFISGATGGTGVYYGTPLAINTWYFITWVIRPNGPVVDKVYFNTTYKAPDVTQQALGPITESNPLRIGYCSPQAYSPLATLNGRVGAFIAYDRELSVTEITQNFNSTKTKYGY